MTEQDYRNYVETTVQLVNGELANAEAILHSDAQAVAAVLPKLISMVNFIGYLRGQDNMFLTVRPQVDFQNELYDIERAAEQKLSVLMDAVLASPYKDEYIQQLQQYYVAWRSQE